MSPRLPEFVSKYTRDLKAEDLGRLFTRDAREAYEFFARTIDPKELEGLSWQRRVIVKLRLFFTAFTMKLSPARRVVYAASIIFAIVGVFNLMQFQYAQPAVENAARVQTPLFPDGLFSLVIAFVLVNLIVLLEVADYFSKYEPHSPISTSLQEIVRRGRLPFSQLLAELLPDTTAWRSALTSAGITPPDATS